MSRRLACLFIGAGLMTGLTACGDRMGDLRQYTNEVKARKGGHIEPIPQIQPFEVYTYADQDMRSPFVQGGVGAVRQSFDVGPVGTHATNTAYNVGAGADIALAPRLGLQLMAKDYIGKFDAREATSVNVDTRTTHTWALSAGLRLGL